MVLKYHISPYPDLLESMTVLIYEAPPGGGEPTSGSEVFTIVIPERNGAGVPTVGAGHQVPYTVIANGLDFVVHVVRLYSTVSAALLHNYNAEPKKEGVTVFDPIRFKIGDGGPNTPAAGSNECVNALLSGMGDEDYTVHRNNYGYLFPGLHYTTDGANNKFVLTPPDAFGPDEEFLVQRKSLTFTSIANDSVVGKWFAGFVDVAANLSYLSAHLRKLIRFAGTCAYTFEAADAIPIGYAFCFQHFGALGTGTINFLNAPLLWGATTKSSIDLRDYEQAAFVFDGANWNVVYISSSEFVNIPGVPPGTILGTGDFNIGDLAGGDIEFVISHNLGIVGDYNVIVCVRGTSASRGLDNDVIVIWYHDVADKPNKFRVCCQEKAAGVQNMGVAWLIIKK